ncbi:hypothetical protein B0I35DRAFT_222619 [Stachybotrys elegans]|uniref:Uncharacterized protein n=1 Tax=Stachybotrys elegans TaxID=80388 RepID=A0A8K0SSM4_9HYPO|nr:hypothetical protein B0I35DRAFT_222619 [Stachybotrys elegans]
MAFMNAVLERRACHCNMEKRYSDSFLLSSPLMKGTLHVLPKRLLLTKVSIVQIGLMSTTSVDGIAYPKACSYNIRVRLSRPINISIPNTNITPDVQLSEYPQSLCHDMPRRKDTPTPLRLTRSRAKLRGAPPLMRGLDDRGRPIDSLPADPEPMIFAEVRRRARPKIIIRTPPHSTAPRALRSRARPSGISPHVPVSQEKTPEAQPQNEPQQSPERVIKRSLSSEERVWPFTREEDAIQRARRNSAQSDRRFQHSGSTASDSVAPYDIRMGYLGYTRIVCPWQDLCS